MAIKISVQNKGGKEVVKGGLEVSSEVSSRLLTVIADLSVPYLRIWVVRKLAVLRSTFDIQCASVARIMSEGSQEEPMHACRELLRT